MLTCTFEDNKSTHNLRHVVVDILVLRSKEILLEKRALTLSKEPGKWALPGGFVNREERLQEAAAREILEETGYKVHNMQLLMVQDNPNRPNDDRQNIVFLFTCDAGEKGKERDSEASEIRWFPLTHVPLEEKMAFDHYKMIQLYIGYKKNKISLPILGHI